MNSTKQAARIAGVLYLVNGVTGFFGIVYVPSKLIVSGNTAMRRLCVMRELGRVPTCPKPSSTSKSFMQFR
jgi:hypothetical protein